MNNISVNDNCGLDPDFRPLFFSESTHKVVQGPTGTCGPTTGVFGAPTLDTASLQTVVSSLRRPETYFPLRFGPGTTGTDSSVVLGNCAGSTGASVTACGWYAGENCGKNSSSFGVGAGLLGGESSTNCGQQCGNRSGYNSTNVGMFAGQWGRRAFGQYWDWGWKPGKRPLSQRRRHPMWFFRAVSNRSIWEKEQAIKAGIAALRAVFPRGPEQGLTRFASGRTVASL